MCMASRRQLEHSYAELQTIDPLGSWGTKQQQTLQSAAQTVMQIQFLFCHAPTDYRWTTEQFDEFITAISHGIAQQLVSLRQIQNACAARNGGPLNDQLSDRVERYASVVSWVACYRDLLGTSVASLPGVERNSQYADAPL